MSKQKFNEYQTSLVSSINARFAFENENTKATKHTLKVLEETARVFSSDIVAKFAHTHNVNADFANVNNRKDSFLNIKSVEEVKNILLTLAQDKTFTSASASRLSFMRYAQILLVYIARDESKTQFSNAELRSALAKEKYDTSTQVAQTSIFVNAMCALNLAERVIDESALNVSEKHAFKFNRESALFNKMLASAIA